MQNQHLKVVHGQKVTLPEGIKVIGDEAFSTVYRLTEINLPDGLETIGDKAFYYNSLKSTDSRKRFKYWEGSIF